MKRREEETTLEVMSVVVRMVETALVLSRRVLNAGPTKKEERQLAVAISELDLTRARLTDSIRALVSGQTTIRLPSQRKIQEIKTLAAKVDTLSVHSAAASTAIQEVGKVLTTAAIIFDPWPGSGGKKP